jgi:hypothetical protein
MSLEEEILEPKKGKRGRKSKKEMEELDETNILKITEEDDDNGGIDLGTAIGCKIGLKKRGRKPKGGKIIQQTNPIFVEKELKPNVILHLKCFLKDLDTNAEENNPLESFCFSHNKNELSYDLLSSSNDNKSSQTQNTFSIIDNSTANKNDFVSEEVVTQSVQIKETYQKLKQLDQILHINNIGDKKSCCFWCTYDFDNPSVYIPKYFLKNSYHVYGCFCSPECATAFLMDENIDSSTKFERYHLLNHIYSKIYNYTKNIKPAPNPYYVLNKYYGNLTIQEYRSLLRNDRLFLIVDKPLTKILPELHEDNDDFIINNKIIPSNNFQVKKKIQKKTATSNLFPNK